MKHLKSYDLYEASVETEDLIVIPTSTDKSFTTNIIFPEHKDYHKLESVFQNQGHGFTDPQAEREIWIDGAEVQEEYFTENHLRAIEAHEIGHHILKHESPSNEEQEQEADIAAIAILKADDEMETVSILSLRFRELYGSNPKDFLLRDSKRELLRAYLKKRN